MERMKVAAQRRLSSESSSYSSCSSGTSYYDWGGSIISDDDDDVEEEESNRSACRRSLKSRSFFDDVKVILSRHDSKLSKFEDDLSCVVRWLNQKFDFILKYESTSSIPSMWEDREHAANVTNSDDPMSSINEGLNKRAMSSSLAPTPLSHILENESYTEENEDNEVEEYTARSMNSSLEHHSVDDNIAREDEQLISSHGKHEEENSYDDFLREESSETVVTNNITPSRNFPASSPANNPSTSFAAKDVKKGRPTKGVQSTTCSKELQRTSQCDTCGKFLKDQSSLRQHKKIHLNIRPFVCTETDCGKSFRRKFHLQTHALIHKGVKNHQCGYCGRCFLLQKDLHTHERIHTGEKPYVCPECPKSFTLKSHLVMHVRTHTGERPYKCDICNKTFAQSNTLRLHKKNLHQVVAGTSTGLPIAPKKSGAKKEKVPKKAKEKTPVLLNATLPSTTVTPAKLPIYRNQSAVLTTFKNIPRITPTVTILQQPMIANQTFEFLEPIDTININSAEKIVLTESTINMLSSAMSSASGMNTATLSNSSSVPVISPEILNFPQHILIPRNNNL